MLSNTMKWFCFTLVGSWVRSLFPFVSSLITWPVVFWKVISNRERKVIEQKDYFIFGDKYQMKDLYEQHLIGTAGGYLRQSSHLWRHCYINHIIFHENHWIPLSQRLATFESCLIRTKTICRPKLLSQKWIRLWFLPRKTLKQRKHPETPKRYN